VEEVTHMRRMNKFIRNVVNVSVQLEDLEDDERAILKYVLQNYYVGLLTGIFRLVTPSIGTP
jgi:hypothetical protein